MPLQIQYQPNAMMLGSMAQSAGEASYNRWLTEFNQQKMQTNANAFMSGFANMGLPIAQMKSRERMINAQIAGRGQQLAQKGLADVQWWDDNGALVQDAVSSNLIAQHGPGVINDSMFADRVINAPKYMSREDAQSMLTRHAGYDERARSHRVARSPESLVARSSGRLADVEAATRVNPVSQQQYDTLQRRFNERGIKGSAYEKMRRGIDERIKRYGDEASRRPTIEETTQRFVKATPLGDGPLDGIRTVVLDKDGGVKQILDTNPNAELMKLHAQNTDRIAKLTTPPSTLEAGVIELDPTAKKARDDTVKQLIRSNKRIMDKVFGPSNVPVEEPIDAAEEYQTNLERWNSQTALGPPEARGVPGTPFGEMSNEEYLKSIQKSGLLLNLMKTFGVEDASDLPREVWDRLGFTAPYPKKPDTRGVMQQTEEDTQKAVKDAGVLNQLDQLRESGRTGQQSRFSVEQPPIRPTLLRPQLEGVERQERMEAMAPKSVDDAKNIRTAIGKQYGRDMTKWPDEAKLRWRAATEFMREAMAKARQQEAEKEEERKIKEMLKSMGTRGSSPFGPSSSSPM